MPLNSRAKGLRGENEAISLLQPVCDKVTDLCGQPRMELVRDTRQRYEAKHYDIFGCPWIALEIKRHENLQGLEGWWKQVKDAAGPKQIPVLMYRQNNAQWRVRMKAPIYLCKGKIVRMTVNITLGDFLIWFEQKLMYELSRGNH